MKPQTVKYGKRITDSVKPQTIWVKERDIIGAVCRDHQKCAVARAIKRQTGAAWVDVGASTVLIGQSKVSGKRFLLSAIARKQVRFFDINAAAMAPCKMTLAAPRVGNENALGGRTGHKARSGSQKQRRTRQIPTR